MPTLTQAQLLVLGAANIHPTPSQELALRLNLELAGHQALDIPVTRKNRLYWNSVYQAQHQDPVYADNAKALSVLAPLDLTTHDTEHAQ